MSRHSLFDAATGRGCCISALSHDPAGGTEDAVPDGLPEWVRAMSADMDLEALAEHVVARDLDVAFPHLLGDDVFADHLRASVRENLAALRDVLCGRQVLAEVRLEQPLTFGAVQAQLGIPQTALQRSYRVGFLVMWEAWSRRLTELAEASDVPRQEALGALSQLAETIFGYQDHVASQVAENHVRADEALSRSRAHVRAGLVRQILRGGATDLAPSDLLTIDYDFEASHVAVLLPALAEGAAARLLFGIRAATGVRHTLVHPLNLGSTVLWLGHPPGWTPAMLASLRRVLGSTQVEACASDPQRGLAGFVKSFGQAQDVEQVRTAWGRARAPRVVQYAEVGLEILLLRDRELARGFVRGELGPLAEDTTEAARLRDTLEASFRFGSHVATAEHLQLHEHTVRNRIARAQEVLGRPLHERRTEIQVALRLQHLLTRQEPMPDSH